MRDKDSNVSWVARQRFFKVCAGLANAEPITDPDMLQACREGHIHEADAGATAVKHMLSHTNGHAEQVGIVALPGDLNWIKASPDYVLHKPEACASFPGIGIGPLECKKTFEKYRCFDGRPQRRHLLQVMIQMKALNTRWGYLMYWTPSSSYLFHIQFDDELWQMMEDGLRVWRDALEDNENSAPETDADKQRSKDIHNRLGVLIDNIFARGHVKSFKSHVTGVRGP